jgi:chloramphenicol 3-O phosphotransferase
VTTVIVLNGGSCAGKSSIPRSLQAVLNEAWLTLGVDTLIDAMPPALRDDDAGLSFPPGGHIAVGPVFRGLETAWYAGIAAMARAGSGIIVDEVFLDAAESQARLRAVLDRLAVLWVGVRCESSVATAREQTRDDRSAGTAARQADRVHEGVVYDLEVDTTNSTAIECARVIAAAILGSDVGN